MITAAWCGPCSIGFTALASADMAYYQTGSLSTAIHVGGRAALSSAMFYSIGELGQAGYLGEGGTQYLGKIALHGVAGGLMSVMQGGQFAHGFTAAGFTAAASPLIANAGGGLAGRSIIAAVVGGTASAMSGGKFANGAMTGAFSYVLNFTLHSVASDPSDVPGGTEYSKALTQEKMRLMKMTPGEFEAEMKIWGFEGWGQNNTIEIAKLTLAKKFDALIIRSDMEAIKPSASDLVEAAVGAASLASPQASFIFSLYESVNLMKFIPQGGEYHFFYKCTGATCNIDAVGHRE